MCDTCKETFDTVITKGVLDCVPITCPADKPFRYSFYSVKCVPSCDVTMEPDPIKNVCNCAETKTWNWSTGKCEDTPVCDTVLLEFDGAQ
jgi:hypothetical protein